MPGTSNNPAGRPRSDDLTDRLYAALWRLLEETTYNALTMERIADEAGVSRPALYRRYANIGALTLGALLAAGASTLPMPETANLEEDLSTYLTRVSVSLRRSSPIGRALRGTLAHALTKDEFSTAFSEFLQLRRRPVLDRLALAYPHVSETQSEFLADLLFGPVLYRVLIRQKDLVFSEVGAVVRSCLANIAGL